MFGFIDQKMKRWALASGELATGVSRRALHPVKPLKAHCLLRVVEILLRVVEFLLRVVSRAVRPKRPSI
jgi:hypothetical protein